MGTSTSNQELGITTTTSDHSAKTAGATDVNWNPPHTVAVPHPNEVATTKATEHTTGKTLFGGGNVVRQGDAIGPMSDPAHPDSGGGVVSGTYRLEARVTTGSPNVKTEGTPLARNTDPTTQNHANTTGAVQGGDPNDALKALAEEKLKACSLDTTKVLCGHGREPGAEKYLEITAKDTVDLEATRKNAKTSGAPDCPQKLHTKWVVTRTKSGKQEKKEELVGDKKKLDNSWFTWGDLDSGGETENGVELEAKDRKATDEAAHYKANKPKKSGRAATQKRRANAQAFAEKRAVNAADLASVVNGAQEAYKATTSLVDFFKVWNAEPIQVTVEAFACSGGDKYVIKSYPGKEIEFSIGEETLKKIKAAVNVIQKIFRGVQKVAALAGVPAKANVVLFKDPTLTMTCKWEEMDKDVPAIKKYKYHCDRGWSFDVSATLAETEEEELSFGLPIALFANLFVPGAGSAINTALNYIGFEATIGFDIKFSIKVGIWGERKPGDLQPTFGGGFPIDISIYARVKIAWKSALEVSGGVIAEGTPKLTLRIPTIDLFSTEVVLLAGEIKMGFKGFAKVDLYFWGAKWEGTHFPEAAKVNYPESVMKVFAMVKQ